MAQKIEARIDQPETLTQREARARELEQEVEEEKLFAELAASPLARAILRERR